MEDIGELAGEQLLFLVGQLEVRERRDTLHIGGRQVSGHCGDRTWKRANGKSRGSCGTEALPRFDLVIPVQESSRPADVAGVGDHYSRDVEQDARYGPGEAGSRRRQLVSS